MPWVLWDIVFPLLAAFAVGLATGWLLWRWRRQQQKLATPLAAQSAEVPVNGSATVLIEERDAALERAESAEDKVQQLSLQLANSQASLNDDIDTALAMADSLDVETPLHTSAEAGIAAGQATDIAELELQLKKEQTTKAELEQAFMDLNNRYKNLSQQLDEAMDENNAALVRDSATLQSQYDSSQQQLTEQQQKLQQTLGNHEQQTRQLNQTLAARETEIQQLKAEKNEAEKSLREHLSAQQQANHPADNDSSLASQTAPQGGKVHHLSSYSTAHKSPEPAVTPVESGFSRNTSATTVSVATSESTKEASATSRAASPAPVSHASDARLSSGANAAQAVSTVEVQDNEAAIDVANQSTLVDEALPASPQIAQTQDNIAHPPNEDKQPAENSRAKTVVKKTASGYAPVAWAVPEITPKKSERDDLQEIKGVGPVLEKLLHKTGIYYFKQVALLDKKGVDELDAQLTQFPGRIQRDKWVSQAKSLHRSKYGEAAKHS